MRALKSLLLVTACAVPLTVLATAPAPKKDDGLHPDWIDKSVDPTQDFFDYANGGWMKAHPIPGDHSSFGSFDILYDHNQDVLREVVEQASKQKAKPGSDAQKVADFYSAGMDEKAIEAAGAKPLDDELARIAGIKDAQGLEDEVAHLHMIGVTALFRFGETQDLHDSSKVIGAAFQGGLGLPDRDYYVKTADKC